MGNIVAMATVARGDISLLNDNYAEILYRKSDFTAEASLSSAFVHIAASRRPHENANKLILIILNAKIFGP